MKIEPGTKFNRLTYVRPAGRKPHGNGSVTIGEYLCDCGKTVILPDYRVKGGYTKSCGCLQREWAYKKCFKHGKSKTKLYGVWDGIITRCENMKHHDYQHYGAKGVRMCDEWRNDFSKFYDWAIENGWKEGLTIDRISGGSSWYSPENCRVVDRRAQSENRCVTVYLLYEGIIITVSKLAKRLGMTYQGVYSRFRKDLMIKKQDGTYEFRFDSDRHGNVYERSREVNVQEV